MNDHLKWALLGVGGLLVAKYIVFGLDAWDGALHPGRTEPANLNCFKKPLMGVLQ